MHNALVAKGIIDGSSNSLVADFLDGTKTDDQLVSLVVGVIRPKNLADEAEKLAYLAIGGFAKFASVRRLKRALYKYKKELYSDFVAKNITALKHVVKDSNATEDVILKSVKSRLHAIDEVLNLRGDHFLKRARFVAKGYQI